MRLNSLFAIAYLLFWENLDTSKKIINKTLIQTSIYKTKCNNMFTHTVALYRIIKIILNNYYEKLTLKKLLYYCLQRYTNFIQNQIILIVLPYKKIQFYTMEKNNAIL